LGPVPLPLIAGVKFDVVIQLLLPDHRVAM
jgi:hypothetical protein